MTFSIGKGTNISHWLSQSKDRDELRRKKFTKADAERIAEWGMDHIRIPVDEEQMWTRKGKREEEAFDLLGTALEWAEENGLKAIVDLHILRSHYFNDSSEPVLYSKPREQKKLAAMWEDLSDFLKNYPNDFLAYELLNEAVAKDPRSWNRVYQVPYEAIRRREPDRCIVLGSNHFNQVQTFPYLRIPDDRNILLTFHYYNPMFVTHWKASWWHIGGTYGGPIQYPGFSIPYENDEDAVRYVKQGLLNDCRYYDKSVMKADISVAYLVAKAHDLPLHCGEFGSKFGVPDHIRSKWYTDLVEIFDEFGIAWSNWDYKGGFGLIDADGTETIALKSLLGR